MVLVNLFMVSLIFVCWLLSCAEAHAFQDRVWSYDKKIEFLSWQTFSLTHGNFDSLGSGYDRLPAGHRYYIFHVSPQLRYSLGHWGFKLGGRYGYGVSENLVNQRQNGQIDSFNFGLDSAFVVGSWKMIPYVHYVLPVFSNDLNQDIVAVGDGARMVQLGVDVRLQGALPLRVFGEYQMRDLLSDLFRFQTDIGWAEFYLGLEGLVTVREQKGSQSVVTQWQCLANGCSQSAMAWNPQRYQIYVGYQSRSWGLVVQQAFQGKNSAYETLVGIVFRFHQEQKTGGSSFERRLDQFQEESLYRDESGEIPIIRPRSIDPNHPPKEKTERHRHVQPKRKKTRQQKLNDIERQLERRNEGDSNSQERLDELPIESEESNL